MESKPASTALIKLPNAYSWRKDSYINKKVLWGQIQWADWSWWPQTWLHLQPDLCCWAPSLCSISQPAVWLDVTVVLYTTAAGQRISLPKHWGRQILSNEGCIIKNTEELSFFYFPKEIVVTNSCRNMLCMLLLFSVKKSCSHDCLWFIFSSLVCSPVGKAFC